MLLHMLRARPSMSVFAFKPCHLKHPVLWQSRFMKHKHAGQIQNAMQ